MGNASDVQEGKTAKSSSEGLDKFAKTDRVQSRLGDSFTFPPPCGMNAGRRGSTAHVRASGAAEVITLVPVLIELSTICSVAPIQPAEVTFPIVAQAQYSLSLNEHPTCAVTSLPAVGQRSSFSRVRQITVSYPSNLFRLVLSSGVNSGRWLEAEHLSTGIASQALLPTKLLELKGGTVGGTVSCPCE